MICSEQVLSKQLLPYCMPSPLQEPAASAAGGSPQLRVAQCYPGPHSLSIRSVSKPSSLLGPPFCSKSVKINWHLLSEHQSPHCPPCTFSLFSHHIRREVTLSALPSPRPVLCSLPLLMPREKMCGSCYFLNLFLSATPNSHPSLTPNSDNNTRRKER